MVFFAQLLVGQAGLVQAAGGGAGQVFGHQRVDLKHRKSLLRQQDVAAGALFHPVENFQVAGQRGFVHQVDRCAQIFCAAGRHGAYSTVAGCSSTTQGRPYWFSISMNGSGSISSRLKTPGFFQVPFTTRAAPIMAGTPVV